MNRVHILLAVVLLLSVAGSVVAAVPVDTGAVDRATGLVGALTGERIYRLTVPREDVRVTVGDAPLPTAVGLTGWVAFKPGLRTEVDVMGDLVLFADEIGDAIAAAVKGGLHVTSLRNPHVGESPRVYVMHMEAEGATAELAAAVGKTLAAVRAVRARTAQVGVTVDASPLNGPGTVSAATLDAIFGGPGEVHDGCYHWTLGRLTTLASCGCQIGEAMGVQSQATFCGTDERAFVIGRIACYAAELMPALKALTAGGVHVTSIGNSMAIDLPRVFFVHFQTTGRAADVARTLKSALGGQSLGVRPD